MRSFFFKISYIFIFFALMSNLKIKADKYPLDSISGQNSELFIESNKQRSDLDNSVFYAEGDVIITNNNKEFIAKSKKAIFYKLKGKIKLSGNVEVFSGDMNKINAGEVIYYVKENKFEAVSDENQKVKTKFFFNDKNLLDKTIEK
tara:strand:+ start:226 stop:663 length:438 start_codon:yes stop_codon:yes gene_type:complete